MRLAVGCGLVAVLLTAASPALGQTRASVTIETLLDQESLGQVRISRDGRWIVVERRAAWSSAATYRFGLMTPHLLSGLEIHTPAGAPVRRLEDPGHASGYVSGPFSPGGDRMLVFRLQETSWRLGVMTLATGQVRWLPLTPEFTGLGRTVAWRSETQLVAIARPDDDLPLVFRLGGQTEARKTALWRTFAAGHAPSAVLIPSGAARDSRTRSGPARLILFDLQDGEERVLARGDLFDLEVSPDGGAVAALLNAEDLQADGETPVTVGTPSRRRRLLLVDLDRGGEEEPLPDQDFLSHLLSWSPDSRRLLAFARDAGGDWADARFWTLDRRGRAEAVALGTDRPWLDEEVGKIPIARGGWSAARPVVQVRTVNGERVWLRSGPTPTVSPVRTPRETLIEIGGRTWIERPDGLHPLPSQAEPRVVAGRLWDRERAADGGSRQGWNPDGVQRGQRVLMDPGGCLSAPAAPQVRTCLSPLAVDESLVAVSPTRTYLIAQTRSAGGSVSLRLHAADAARPLATVNPAFDNVAWGEIVPVRHPGPDGQTLTSWLLMPPGTPSGARPPVAVVLYPGTDYPAAPAWMRPGGERLHINPQVLAAAGYAVLVPSLPRRTGPGPGLENIADRIQAIIDAAGERVDAGRVGLIGHSYGGYAALLATSQSDQFRAVIAAAGYADLSRTYALPPHFLVSPDDGVPINALAGWAETGQGGIGASLVERPQAYVDNSPLYLAERIRTPALLIEGDLDPVGADVLFGALYRLDREAAFLTYAGEGHVFVSPANLRDLHARILDWLDRYVRPTDVVDAGLPASSPDLQNSPDQ